MQKSKIVALLLVLATLIIASGCTMIDNVISSLAPQVTVLPSSTPIVVPSTTPTIKPSLSPSVVPSPSPTLSPSPIPTPRPTADLSALDNTKQGWGPGAEVDGSNRPISAESYQEKYGAYDALFILPDTDHIYLTFDEGYENGYTAAILDTLSEKKVKAVFFVTGSYVQKNPDLVQRMIDEGHMLGNHSWTHPSLPDKSIDEATDEIMQLHNYVLEHFGYTMTLFRPPMGEFSDRTLALTQALGYKTVLWSFAYRDWETDNQMEPAMALQKITDAAHPGGLFLLHAVSSTNAAILGDVIDAFGEDSLTFSLIK